MRYDIVHEGKVVGHFDLTPMPGCSRVGISHGLVIDDEFRNKAHGTRAQAERLKLAKQLGFDVLLATTVDSNVAQQKILSRSHWKVVTTFDNPKTGNRVVLWSKSVTDPYDCGFYEPGGCR